MKVIVKTSFGEMSFEMEQAQTLKLMRAAMELAAEKEPLSSPEPPVSESQPTRRPAPHSRVEHLFPGFHAAPPAVEEAAPDGQKGYKGFLLVKCQHCGEVHGFCAKTSLWSYKCRCGQETPLRDMRLAYLECKCESAFKYLTNIAEPQFTYFCLNCHAPVNLELNKNGTAYLPVSRGRDHRKGGPK